MQSALNQFQTSINRVRDLISVHNTIQSQVTNALDLSDLLRAALVLAVSALDYYIHEVIRLGMLEIHRGQRPEPGFGDNTNQSQFSKFKISLGNAQKDRNIAINITSWLDSEIQQTYGDEFLQNYSSISELLPILSSSIFNRLNSTSWLEDEIRSQHSYKSFQQPDKIAEAIRLISHKKLWDEVATELGKSAKETKQKLSIIVDRRNKIAHEADIDPTLGLGNRWEIEQSEVSDAVDFIEQVVESIHKLL